MIESDNLPPLFQRAWGQTLDLEQFEAVGSRESGAAERVCARIEARHLNGATIPFEYLGRLQETRGTFAGTDADFANIQIASDRIGHAKIVEQI